jgi:hypothetical protein
MEGGARMIWEGEVRSEQLVYLNTRWDSPHKTEIVKIVVFADGKAQMQSTNHKLVVGQKCLVINEDSGFGFRRLRAIACPGLPDLHIEDAIGR